MYHNNQFFKTSGTPAARAQSWRSMLNDTNTSATMSGTFVPYTQLFLEISGSSATRAQSWGGMSKNNSTSATMSGTFVPYTQLFRETPGTSAAKTQLWRSMSNNNSTSARIGRALFAPSSSEVADNENTEVPNRFICPITQDVMKDPVATQVGQVYERAAIEEWLRAHNTDPVTREKIKKNLIPLHFLRSEIQTFKDTTPNSLPVSYSAQKMAKLIITYALNGYEADEMLGLEMILGVRLNGYLGLEKEKEVVLHLQEQLERRFLQKQPLTVQKIIVYELAKHLQSYLEADNSPKKRLPFSTSNTLKQHVHINVSLADLGQILSTKVDRVLTALSSGNTNNNSLRRS
jgi:hypothetical protein